MNRTVHGYAMRGALKAALLALALALVLAPLFGCASTVELAEVCGTDTECEQQCLAELRPDEDPNVCAVSLAALKP